MLTIGASCNSYFVSTTATALGYISYQHYILSRKIRGGTYTNPGFSNFKSHLTVYAKVVLTINAMLVIWPCILLATVALFMLITVYSRLKEVITYAREQAFVYASIPENSQSPSNYINAYSTRKNE
jgi:hypothetical protein